MVAQRMYGLWSNPEVDQAIEHANNMIHIELFEPREYTRNSDNEKNNNELMHCLQIQT
jgi:hypothetical protein